MTSRSKPDDFAKLAAAIMKMPWKRTCQECGHAQGDKDPSNLSGAAFERFRDRKCKHCKSEALDWGMSTQTQEDDTDG